MIMQNMMMGRAGRARATSTFSDISQGDASDDAADGGADARGGLGAEEEALFACGLNDCGQLGLGHVEGRSEMTVIQLPRTADAERGRDGDSEDATNDDDGGATGAAVLPRDTAATTATAARRRSDNSDTIVEVGRGRAARGSAEGARL
jgi:hypothetical protein